MSESTLKKIIIESYSGYFSRPQFEDKFVLTNNSVSYKKVFSGPSKYNEDGEPIQNNDIQWSYKTKNPFIWFNALQMDLEMLEQEEQNVLDAGGFSIEIVYENGDKKSLHYFDIDDVKNENLQHIFFLLRKVIPPQEETPNYMRLLDSVDCCLVKEMIASLENNEPYNGDSLREDFLLRLVEFDFEYDKITDRLERDNFPIETFSFDEIRAFITYMARAEHWSEGSFEEFLKDGTVLRVLKRLKELTYEDDEED